MWKGRFKEDTAEVVQRFTESLGVDWPTFGEDIRGSKAHVRMLAKVGLLSEEEGRELLEGLDRVEEEIRRRELTPSVKLEDVHMNIESRLIELLGPLGARLHMGRSRNDQSNTSVRLHLRKRLANLGLALGDLMEVLLEKANQHIRTIVPGYTHLQQAQPVSMGHYWMSHFAGFQRDMRRLLFALESLDECPLGAGALAGSTLPLDREYSAKLLGFSKPTTNSMDTVGNRDYQSDYHHFAALFMIHCSRLAEDLIVYSSQEFRWIELPDAFCTGSSMMPQKKNADVLEIIRGKTGQVVGKGLDLLITVKGLPSTFNRDMQEDKQSLWSSLDTLTGVLEVFPALLARVEVRQEEARRAFEGGTILATDVAEYLVRLGVPFREAHEKVGRAVAWCQEHRRPLDKLTPEEWQALIPEARNDLPELLTPEKAVAARQTLGGTGFEQVERQIARGRETVHQAAEELREILER